MKNLVSNPLWRTGGAGIATALFFGPPPGPGFAKRGQAHRRPSGTPQEEGIRQPGRGLRGHALVEIARQRGHVERGVGSGAFEDGAHVGQRSAKLARALDEIARRVEKRAFQIVDLV
jgi:hypothetical protein